MPLIPEKMQLLLFVEWQRPAQAGSWTAEQRGQWLHVHRWQGHGESTSADTSGQWPRQAPGQRMWQMNWDENTENLSKRGKIQRMHMKLMWQVLPSARPEIHLRVWIPTIIIFSLKSPHCQPCFNLVFNRSWIIMNPCLSALICHKPSLTWQLSGRLSSIFKITKAILLPVLPPLPAPKPNSTSGAWEEQNQKQSLPMSWWRNPKIKSYTVRSKGIKGKRKAGAVLCQPVCHSRGNQALRSTQIILPRTDWDCSGWLPAWVHESGGYCADRTQALEGGEPAKTAKEILVQSHRRVKKPKT